jgi:uncharacterized membrane protein YbhN (UPF0104 family)
MQPEAGRERMRNVLTQTGRFAVLNPIGDHSRLRRLGKVAGWMLAIAAVVAGLDQLGVDVQGWLSGLWHSISAVPAGYLVAAVIVQGLQTVFTATTWLFVLRAAYHEAHVPFPPVLAAYAVGTALNGVFPASLGTVVMLYILLAAIPTSTFSGLLAAAVVQKLAFTVLSGLVYVYLFLSVPGSFTVELGGLRDHPVLVPLLAAVVIAVLVGVGRLLWPKLRSQWRHAKQGGSILSSPREYLVRVGLPSLAGYSAKLIGAAIFLAAFAIPVTFDSILHVVGGNSIAGATAVTPGGAGVNEAVSVVSLSNYTDAQTAAAFSVAQHLVGTAWNILFALILVPAVFGWRNGEAMLKSAAAAARERRAAHSDTAAA